MMSTRLLETCREYKYIFIYIYLYIFIYIYKELCVKLVIYWNYTEMHGHKNIKFQDYVSKGSEC